MSYLLYLSTLARTGLSDKAATSHTWLWYAKRPTLISTLKRTHEFSYLEAFKCLEKLEQGNILFRLYVL